MNVDSYGSNAERETLEQMSVNAEQKIMEAWRSLQDAARSLGSLGADVSEFDQLFRAYCETSASMTASRPGRP